MYLTNIGDIAEERPPAHDTDGTGGRNGRDPCSNAPGLPYNVLEDDSEKGEPMAIKDQKDKAWDNAKRIRGKDPEKYRQDPYGKTIYKASYGKDSDMGWEVDHINPQSKGGSSSPKNLQALNVATNRSKGDDERKKSRHSKTNK